MPALLLDSDEETRDKFAMYIEQKLRDMDESQQQEWWSRWLHQYWENRLKNIPVPLSGGEVVQMLDWLSHLSAVFPEAVKMAIDMPIVPIQHLSLIHDLKDSVLVQKFPEATAMLLIYLGGYKMPPYSWYGIEDVIKNLNRAALGPVLNQRFEEFLATLP